MIQFDQHIFQTGWNHQLETLVSKPWVGWSRVVSSSDRRTVSWSWKQPLDVSARGRKNSHVGRKNVMGFFPGITPPETNIAPENGWLEY